MARFDVYADPDGNALLLDCQANIFADELPTRFVVPLLPLGEARLVTEHLNPIFAVKGDKFAMATQLAAAVPATILKTPIASLAEQEYVIGRAIDVLLGGV